ncbi:histidine kinase [Massilia sp. IC2-477]|uniref:sensor histidine kinase n=1 Tax=Massilia sp. IC2-477 TaxID=2887198 RepID=UPI001D11F907|nr:histidine kinase [Massilia sp. IC2-477]MCC2957464.1 histidine kinase [Massilia sp. IC2-477]
MWRKIINWYTELEREQLALLERPELAAQVPCGYRRKMADGIALMSPIERQQLRAFMLRYRGPRLWIALAALFALFTLAGLALELMIAKGRWWIPVIAANLMGVILILGGTVVWFNASQLLRHKRRLVWGVFGGGVGAYCGMALTSPRPLSDPALLKVVPMGLLASTCVAIPFLALGVYRRRQHAALTAQLQRQAESERLARELSESKLRMLRAQIEPHFLFNTLGAVQQLATDGAPRAAALTADLIAFLRASFSDMRAETVTLSSEFTTISSYLRVMQARMGARLRFDVSLPVDLARTAVPSMLVLTLVENAIKHGIEPSLRGGDIRVSAVEDGGTMRIRVHDSGVGMSDTPGNGAGLDNVRRRLQLAYGDAAGLALIDADPGLLAEITIPAMIEVAA